MLELLEREAQIRPLNLTKNTYGLKVATFILTALSFLGCSNKSYLNQTQGPFFTNINKNSNVSLKMDPKDTFKKLIESANKYAPSKKADENLRVLLEKNLGKVISLETEVKISNLSEGIQNFSLAIVVSKSVALVGENSLLILKNNDKTIYNDFTLSVLAFNREGSNKFYVSLGSLFIDNSGNLRVIGAPTFDSENNYENINLIFNLFKKSLDKDQCKLGLSSITIIPPNKGERTFKYSEIICGSQKETTQIVVTNYFYTNMSFQ